jgi:endo-1,4-beta-xylanase
VGLSPLRGFPADDNWANPTDTWETFSAARKVYDFLNADQKIGIAYRPGGHEHNRQDWTTFLDFVDWHFRGQSPPAGAYAANPFDKENDSE